MTAGPAAPAGRDGTTAGTAVPDIAAPSVRIPDDPTGKDPSGPDLSGHVVVVPGGTGGIGEGVVRAYLRAGADVVVPTRSPARAQEFEQLLAGAPTGRLHLIVADYTGFGGAAHLAGRVRREIGEVDHVVAPIGGWWAGKSLTDIDESDWYNAFVGLATTHMAIVRAFLPRLPERGSYTVVVGTSAETPVVGSGLVSMEQAALLMMRGALAAESGESQRVFALVLGLMATRHTGTVAPATPTSPATPANPDAVTADQVGAVAVAVGADSTSRGRTIHLRGPGELAQALATHTHTAPPAR